MRDRARWAEAARNDPERLELDEFLAFTHPESSHRALLQMVEDLFEKFGNESLNFQYFQKFLNFQRFTIFNIIYIHAALISALERRVTHVENFLSQNCNIFSALSIFKYNLKGRINNKFIIF